MSSSTCNKKFLYFWQVNFLLASCWPKNTWSWSSGDVCLAAQHSTPSTILLLWCNTFMCATCLIKELLVFGHMDAKAFPLKLYLPMGSSKQQGAYYFFDIRTHSPQFYWGHVFPKLKGRGPNTTTMDQGPSTHTNCPNTSTAPESRAAIFLQGLREHLQASDLGFKTKDCATKDRATKDFATQDPEPNDRQPMGQAVGVSGGLQCGATDLCSRRL